MRKHVGPPSNTPHLVYSVLTVAIAESSLSSTQRLPVNIAQCLTSILRFESTSTRSLLPCLIIMFPMADSCRKSASGHNHGMERSTSRPILNVGLDKVKAEIAIERCVQNSPQVVKDDL